MRQRLKPKKCNCGCGGFSKGGNFIRGHDSQLLSKILQKHKGISGLKSYLDSIERLTKEAA